MNKVAINTDGTLTSVVVDGVDYSMKASKVVFEHEAGAIPVVRITLPVDEVEITGVVGSFEINGRAIENGTAPEEDDALVLALQERQTDENLKKSIHRILSDEIKESEQSYQY